MGSLFSPSIYRHMQDTPALTWTINHKLGNNGSQGVPIVDVYISIGGNLSKVISGNVQIVDKNNVTVTFSEAQTGMAVIIV